MPTESLEYRLSISGQSETVGGLSAVKDALARNTSETKKYEDANKLAEAATNNSAKGLTRFGPLLGQTGQAISRLNPVAGQMVSVLGQATGVIQNLASTGLGPLGIAVGAASAAFGIISSAVDGFTNSQQEANRVTHEETLPAIDELIQKLEQSSQDLNRWVALGQGRGGVSGQQAFLQQRERDRAAAEVEISQLNARYDSLDANGRERLVHLEEQLRTINDSIGRREELFTQAIHQDTQAQRNAAALAAIDAANHDVIDRPTHRGGGARQEGITAELLARQLINKANEDAVRLSALQNAALDAEVQLREKLAEALVAEENAAQENATAKQAAFDQYMAQQSEREKAAARAAAAFGKSGGDDKAAEIAETMSKVGEYAGGIGSALTEAIGAADGFGHALARNIKSYLETLGKREAVEAIVETAQGFASIAIGDAKGVAGHFQAAAIHAAAAAAAGAASAAIPGGGGAGGGGARPEREPGSRGGGNGPSTVIIQFGGQVMAAATYAEAGRQVKQALRHAERLDRGDA